MGCMIDCKEMGTACGNKDVELVCAWTHMLLAAMETNAPDQAIKQCSLAHFEALGMKDVLAPFIGRPEAFYQFISEKWNWIITVDPDGKRLLADENKAECVCPLVRAGAAGSPVLCNCSEGFAERMFSTVLQKPVRARVVKSILRGGDRCVYEVFMPDERTE